MVTVLKRIRCANCNNFQLITSADPQGLEKVYVTCVECGSLLYGGVVKFVEESDTTS